MRKKSSLTNAKKYVMYIKKLKGEKVMETTVYNLEEAINNGNLQEERVAVIGKWLPIHLGHEKFLTTLARNYSKMAIMIGSAYQGGDVKHCITATEREKMIRAVLKSNKISDEKYEIIPVSDTPTFDEWFSNVLAVCKKYGVTNFCTGNKEEILNELAKREETYPLKLINPEINSDFPYHATDIRNMIIRGEYEKVEKLIPNAAKPILFRRGFKEIIAASEGRPINFIPGRQTVDMVFLVRDIKTGKIYVLLGNRPKDKKDFPGALALPGGPIEKFETATNAAIRNFYLETGIKVKMLDNSLEPAIVRIENIPNMLLEQMPTIDLYGTQNTNINGTQGGSSQCFGIFVDGEKETVQKYICPQQGLENVQLYEIGKAIKMPLAFQHKEMVEKSIAMFKGFQIYRNLICLNK